MFDKSSENPSSHLSSGLKNVIVDRFISFVDQLRSRTTQPIITGARGLVYGLVVLICSFAILSLLAIGIFRFIENTLPGDNAWSSRLPNKYRLKGVKGAKLSQIYRKLKPNEPSYTVTGSGGGGTHMYHWSENRALTNREKATLQTFPTNFLFKGSKEQVRRQIGMAVPVKMAKIIVTSILKTLSNKSYNSINKNNYII